MVIFCLGILFGINFIAPIHTQYKELLSSCVLLTNLLVPVCLNSSIIHLPDNPLKQLKRISVLDDIYIVEMVWYMYATLNDIIKRKELSFVIHHFVTLALIVIGYYYNMTIGGTVLLLILTSTNPVLELSKLLRSNNAPSLLQNTVFIFFSCMFFTLRVVSFPVLVFYYKQHISWLLWNLLCGLYMLQLHWMIKILKIIKNILMKQIRG